MRLNNKLYNKLIRDEEIRKSQNEEIRKYKNQNIGTSILNLIVIDD